MIANRFSECWLEINETLIESRRIVSIQGYHFGARFAAAIDLKGAFLDACDDRTGNRGGRFTREAHSGPAFDDLIMGVSVAPG